MRILVFFIFMLSVFSCSVVSNTPSKKTLFSSSAVSPITVEQKGDEILITYVSKTETGGVILTKKDTIVLDRAAITGKDGVGSTILSVLEIVFNTVVNAVF